MLSHLSKISLVVSGAIAILAQASVGPAAASSLYSQWPNGPSQAASFFPIGVWWQSPTKTGHSGPYANAAVAAAAEHINIFLGISSSVAWNAGWPERYGQDNGELAALKANNLYLIGNINTPYLQNTSSDSVASVLTLANSIGATANVIGYNAGDEPGSCSSAMQLVPTVISAINGYDPTRVVTYNQMADWMLQPLWPTMCLPPSIAALQATSLASMDLYPVTTPWWPATYKITGGDFLSTPNDSLFLQGVATRALIHYAAANQPTWVYVESGGDNMGFSEQNNTVKASVTNGSPVLTNASTWSKFTTTWVGLTVSGAGIPGNTTIIRVTDATHAVMSAPATATSSAQPVAVTGGVQNSDCVASVNLCVVNSNAYRATPAQVNAEVWMSLISGADGIEYFCHDLVSSAFCLGDVAGGAAATASAANLTYINATVLSFASVLNATTLGLCAMQNENYATGAIAVTTSCSNGVLTMSNFDITMPGAAMVKQVNGVTYLFAQSGRRNAYGVQYRFTLQGAAGKVAKVVYDSNERYDQARSSLGATINISGSAAFTDSFGGNGDDYQVRIYAIQ